MPSITSAPTIEDSNGDKWEVGVDNDGKFIYTTSTDTAQSIYIQSPDNTVWLLTLDGTPVIGAQKQYSDTDVTEVYSDDFSGSGAISSPWVRTFGSNTVNQVGGIGIGSATPSGFLRYQYTTGSLEHCYVQCRLVGGAINTQNQFGLTFRNPTSGVDTGYYVYVQVDGGLTVIEKYVLGSSTTIGDVITHASLSHSDMIKITMSYSTIKFFINSSLTATRTDSDYSSGFAGLLYAVDGVANDVEIDDWSAGTLNPLKVSALVTNVQTQSPSGQTWDWVVDNDGNVSTSAVDPTGEIEVMANTFDFNCTRNEILESAFRKIGALHIGQPLSHDQLSIGVKALNKIVREDNLSDTRQTKNLWAFCEDALILKANGFVYTTDDDLASHIIELRSVVYRDTGGDDTPVQILTAEQYGAISNKNDTGDVEKVYMYRDKTLSSNMLYVWPGKSSVGTTSVVLGTDGLNYSCIMGHESAAINRPITGSSYRLYWSQQGSGGTTWATGTDYTNGELLWYLFKRPLYDFDNAGDNPDYPSGWCRYLEYRLAFDLSPEYAISLDERNWLKGEYLNARHELFPSTQPVTTDTNNKTLFF